MNDNTRRQFLRQAAAHTAAIAGAGPLLLQPAQAALVGSDYRALVCVFLMGGNDGNNTVVPMDSAGYAAYAKARGNAAAGGLSLQASALAPLAGVNLGLHPGLAPLAELWSQGHLAVQANVGTLVKPLSKASFSAASASSPPNLFSHADQQGQWQQGGSGLAVPSGWGGRVADLQPAAAVPTVISVAGNNLFINGATRSGLVVPANGGFAVQGFGGNPASNPLYGIYTSLLRAGSANAEVGAAADVMEQALQASALLNPALAATAVSAGQFAGQTSSIAKQLLAVAKLIEARHSLGVNRQVFFVAMGGFDTHNNQLALQASLLGQLGPALKSFYDAMSQLGLGKQVTSFTASDFARTLQPASGGGSDHAWGNHQFVLGGAVKGGLYGQMPQLVLGGPDDVSSEGRWLPTTAVDQMSATLASWLGVGATDLPTVFPRLANFSRANLGYFG